MVEAQMRCPVCGGYSWISGVCQICNYSSATKPRFELGNIDIFKMADGLAKKKKEDLLKAEKDRRDKIPMLSICSFCQQKSLFYNHIEDKYECLNLKCIGKQNEVK
jgi:hypothetical protein